MPRPTLIRIGDEVFEVVSRTPAGSLFLLNRKGLHERRIEHLETQLEAAHAELTRLERDATAAEILDPVADVNAPVPRAHDADTATLDRHRTHPHAPSEDATGRP